MTGFEIAEAVRYPAGSLDEPALGDVGAVGPGLDVADLKAALEAALLERPELIEPFASGYSRIVRDAIAEERL
jgi:hypothetical protein